MKGINYMEGKMDNNNINYSAEIMVMLMDIKKYGCSYKKFASKYDFSLNKLCEVPDAKAFWLPAS